MEKPKISIIVPIYNVEQYLPRCIDSILSQSFADFELLLVDDGSPDRCGEICDEYARKDDRVRVFHKSNGGVSSARNVGLENACGEWVAFVDADDLVPADGLDTLAGLISPDVDMVMAGYEKIRENGVRQDGPSGIVRKTIDWKQALTEMFCPTDYSYQGYPFSKLYRASVIKAEGLRFDKNIKFNEDRLFAVNFICHSKRQVAYTTKSVYTYLLREGSAMSTLSKGYNRNFTTDFEAFLQMCDIVKSCTNDKALIWYVKSGLCESYQANHKMMIIHNAYDKAIHRWMMKEMVRKGALPMVYVKQSCVKHDLRFFIVNVGLLLFPQLIAKYYKGGVNLVSLPSSSTACIPSIQIQCQCYKQSVVASVRERRAA